MRGAPSDALEFCRARRDRGCALIAGVALKGSLPRRRIVVATLDTLAAEMAGPAIRACEIARGLGRVHDVRLVTLGACHIEGDGFVAEHVEPGEFRGVVDAAEVVVLQGYFFNAFGWLHDCSQVIVVDLYDPIHLETLQTDRAKAPDKRQEALDFALAELDAQVCRGDFFLCASPKQRDLWLGHLAGRGRVNPATYDADPGLRRLIAVVPFGLPDRAPERSAPGVHGIRGVVPGIGSDDKVVLWGGGVYDWFDPDTLIRAIDVVRDKVPQVRLFFMGMAHPNPDVPDMPAAARARALADRLGLVGTHVFFNDGWVAYGKRQDYLLDADVGVSCHHAHLETEFSFRTRILDYLWAQLPVVCTDGDSFGALVTAKGLGVAVPAGDAEALVAALTRVLDEPQFAARCREHVAQAARALRWSRVLEPLVEFCANPQRAADAGRLQAADASRLRGPGRPAGTRRPRRPGLVSDIRTAIAHVRAGGVPRLISKARARRRRRRLYG